MNLHVKFIFFILLAFSFLGCKNENSKVLEESKSKADNSVLLKKEQTNYNCLQVGDSLSIKTFIESLSSSNLTRTEVKKHLQLDDSNSISEEEVAMLVINNFSNLSSKNITQKIIIHKGFEKKDSCYIYSIEIIYPDSESALFFTIEKVNSILKITNIDIAG